LGAIIQNFKSITTRKINQQRGTPGKQIWQRNDYEHIVRNEADLERIRQYIAGNPLRWSQGFRDP
jgi:REP element-mobilizing transposase RayT